MWFQGIADEECITLHILTDLEPQVMPPTSARNANAWAELLARSSILASRVVLRSHRCSLALFHIILSRVGLLVLGLYHRCLTSRRISGDIADTVDRRICQIGRRGAASVALELPSSYSRLHEPLQLEERIPVAMMVSTT